MNKTIAALALALTASLTAAPARATADPDAACPSPAITDAEYAQTDVGMFRPRVWKIVGSKGERVDYGLSSEHIRDFDYCGELSGVPGVRFRFGRDDATGRWVVTDREVL